MYRTLLSILLYLGATATAPPDSSEITYVKIQPVTNEDAPQNPRATQFRESRIENVPLTIRNFNTDENRTKINIRHVRSEEPTTIQPDDSREAEVTTEAILESLEGDDKSYEEKVNIDDYETSKKPPAPRFYSKLSYFQKANDLDSSISTNLVETRPERRRFRSRCRCERIWNCPKLQITVPRCPEEYFLCCF